MSAFPRLIGMIHLAPLAGSPRAVPIAEAIARARRDAERLATAGFDAVMIENFGDVPFYPGRVPAETVAAMTKAALGVREAVELPIGVNVLRNDAESALAIAAAVGAEFIRVNVLVGAMVTDQGLIEGRAHDVLRLRRTLCPDVAIFADVLVKHAEALGHAPDVAVIAEDTVKRGLADALVVSGSGTGRPVDVARLEAVRAAVPDVPVYVGSGLSAKNAAELMPHVFGAIVGSSLKPQGLSGPIDQKRATELVKRVRQLLS